MKPVRLPEVFADIEEYWSPVIVGALNGQQVKLARVKGEFVWHRHEEADELFLVYRGHLRLELRDGAVELGPGDMYIVPRGVEHRPVAAEEVELLLFEPEGTLNTGDVEDERTRRNLRVW